MAFQERQNITITPELVGSEEIDISTSPNVIYTPYQRMGIGHVELRPYWTIQSYKQPEGTKYYCCTWQTDHDSISAGKLIGGAGEIEGLDVNQGSLTIVNEAGFNDYGWSAHSKDKPKDAELVSDESLGLDSARLIRVDAEIGALLWECEYEEWQLPNRISVITSDDFEFSWVKGFFETTATEETKQLVARNIGAVMAKVTTFFELPFGEPVL